MAWEVRGFQGVFTRIPRRFRGQAKVSGFRPYYPAGAGLRTRLPGWTIRRAQMATFLIGAAIAAVLAIATLAGLVLGMTVGGILIKWLKRRRK